MSCKDFSNVRLHQVGAHSVEAMVHRFLPQRFARPIYGLDRLKPRAMVALALVMIAGGRAWAGERPVRDERTRPVRDERTRPVRDERTRKVQRLADRLRTKLEISQKVVISLVPTNPLAASVQPMPGRKGAFLLTIERGFIEGLSEDELTAVVAHELGHVWISTHHPYLQTEQLANRIAMRIVSRDTLARVYGKVWGTGAMQGTLASFLGVAAPPNQVGLAPTTTPAPAATAPPER
jgi:hypothetical protein